MSFFPQIPANLAERLKQLGKHFDVRPRRAREIIAAALDVTSEFDARCRQSEEIPPFTAERLAAEASKTDIGWGHQIRSYVLQPYQMVKDLRTGVETSASGAVLDGDLDRFLQAALAQRIKGQSDEAA